MKEDGKIDPDFARILFYLDLESINKTVIDMQVQNRVVTVTVFNEDDTLKAMRASRSRQVERRTRIGRLSIIGCFFQKRLLKKRKQCQNRNNTLKSDGQGVDFRI